MAKRLNMRTIEGMKAQRGVVLVELALLLPVLLVLPLATVEFAQALAAYKVLVATL